MKHGVRQPVLAGLERADAVAQTLGQHGDHAVGEIHAVAPVVRLAVQRATRRHVVAHVGDVDPEPPPAVGQGRDLDGVVEIARVVRVNREDEFFAQVFAARDLRFVGLGGNLLGGLHDGLGKFLRQVILADDRESMSTPAFAAGPRTSMILPSGLTWRDSHASSSMTTLSPI